MRDIGDLYGNFINQKYYENSKQLREYNMPGFNIQGSWSEGPNAQTEVRRKHRWTFEVPSGTDPQANKAVMWLAKAARPKFKFVEAIAHHDQEQAYWAGKTEWDPINLSFYDAEQDPDVSEFVWDWVNKVVNIYDVTAMEPGGPEGYKKKGEIKMWGNFGTITENWELWNCWPQEANWQELDYSSSDIALVDVTLRFDRAIRQDGE